MPSAAFRASATTTLVSTSGGGSFTINAPVGVQENDRLLLAIYSAYNGQSSTGPVRAMTIPGFAQMANVPYATNISNAELWVFEGVAGASEPATYVGDVTGGEGANLGCALVLAYSGVRPEVASVVAANAGQNQPAVAPALGVATGMSVCFWCFRKTYSNETLTPTTVPGGFTKRAIITGTPNVTIVGGDAIGIAGVLPTESATIGGIAPSGWDAAQIASQPRGGGLTFWM